MEETPTMASAAESASTEIASTNAGADSTASGDQATPQSQPATQQQVTTEDSFFDPKSLSPELIPAYKQMQAAYTKKTQEIANARKEAESLKEKAEKFSRYEQYVPILEEMLKPQQGLQPATRPEIQALEKQLQQQGYSKEAIDLAKTVMQQNLAVQDARDQQAQQQAQQARLQSQIQEAGKLDERLQDANLVYDTPAGKLTYGQIVERMVASDPNWQKDVLTSTKNAIAVVDALIGKAKTEGKMELSASAKAKAQKFPQVSSSPQSAQSETKTYTSMREAANDAANALGFK